MASTDLGFVRPLLTQEAIGDTSDFGPTIEFLVPMLDGIHPIEEILGAALLEGHSPADVTAALKGLSERGALIEADSDARHIRELALDEYSDQICAFEVVERCVRGQHDQFAGLRCQARLAQANVGVVGTGLVADGIVAGLREAGIARVDRSVTPREIFDISASSLAAEMTPRARARIHTRTSEMAARGGTIVYAPDAFSAEDASVASEIAVVRGGACLVVRCLTVEIELGPFYVSRDSSCYNCYLMRRAGFVSNSDELLEMLVGRASGLGSHIASAWAALEIIKHITGITAPTCVNRVMRVDVINGVTKLHSVLRVPRCRVCGIGDAPPLALWHTDGPSD